MDFPGVDVAKVGLADGPFGALVKEADCSHCVLHETPLGVGDQGTPMVQRGAAKPDGYFLPACRQESHPKTHQEKGSQVHSLELVTHDERKDLGTGEPAVKAPLVR